MYSFEFKHNGFQYSLNMSAQTLTNKATGEVRDVEQLRDRGLIAAVSRCVDNAERGKVYEMILGRMIDNIGSMQKNSTKSACF